VFIDSHCHLDCLNLSSYGGSLDRLLDAAREAGVHRFLSVGIDIESSRKILDLAAKYSDVDVSVGLHPLQDSIPTIPSVNDLIALASHPRVVAIGETGLDNYYGKESSSWQQESFIVHLRAASELLKPVIVHTREAHSKTIEILRNYANIRSAGVLHCFTETLEMAYEAIELNFYISFSGIITFKNAAPLRDVVSKIPLDRILIETDSPWLAPIPHRGKSNEPKYVSEVAKLIAEIKEITLDEVCETTSYNYQQLFLSNL
jgi:TatD DNase family protein